MVTNRIVLAAPEENDKPEKSFLEQNTQQKWSKRASNVVRGVPRVLRYRHLKFTTNWITQSMSAAQPMGGWQSIGNTSTSYKTTHPHGAVCGSGEGSGQTRETRQQGGRFVHCCSHVFVGKVSPYLEIVS